MEFPAGATLAAGNQTGCPLSDFQPPRLLVIIAAVDVPAESGQARELSVPSVPAAALGNSGAVTFRPTGLGPANRSCTRDV
jgi:hypothetical protein